MGVARGQERSGEDGGGLCGIDVKSGKNGQSHGAKVGPSEVAFAVRWTSKDG